MKNSETNNIQSHSGNTVLCDGFLIPMTDFVLRINEIEKEVDQFFDSWRMKQLRIIENYAKFLKQPLKLEMFVPCDEDGNVLEYFPIHRFADNPEKYRRYKKAKENVLFELSIDSDYKFDISDYKFICNYYVNLENWLKDNDVLYKIKLSQTALDSIFG